MTKDERRMFMKIKKLSFLSLFLIIGLFLFMPSSVNATDAPVELNKMKIEMTDPQEGEKIPESAKIILTNDTEEVVFDDIKVTWVKYDSEGNRIELDITESSVFEKNIVYKFNFDMDPIQDSIYNETNGYSIADDFKVYINNVCVDANGGSKELVVYINDIKSISIETEDLIVGKPLPKTLKYVYETDSADDKIELVLNCIWLANKIPIYGDAIAEEGVDYSPGIDSNQDDPDYMKYQELSRKQDFRTNMYLNGELISLENGIPSLRAKKEVEYIEKITLNIKNKQNFNDITVDDMVVINFLAHKGLIIPSADNNLYDKNWNLLWGCDEEDNIILADRLTVADNILYTLTPEDEIYYAEYRDIIPKQIELIVSTEPAPKLIFDANGGVFKEDKKSLTIEEWKNEYEETLETPTRDGYTFKGYYTEKSGGTKFELILAESGIDSDMTFYAQWELDEEVPKTLDNITSSIIMGTISLIGLVGATIYFRKRNKVRA